MAPLHGLVLCVRQRRRVARVRLSRGVVRGVVVAGGRERGAVVGEVAEVGGVARAAVVADDRERRQALDLCPSPSAKDHASVNETRRKTALTADRQRGRENAPCTKEPPAASKRKTRCRSPRR